MHFSTTSTIHDHKTDYVELPTKDDKSDESLYKAESPPGELCGYMQNVLNIFSYNCLGDQNYPILYWQRRSFQLLLEEAVARAYDRLACESLQVGDEGYRQIFSVLKEEICNGSDRLYAPDPENTSDKQRINEKFYKQYVVDAPSFDEQVTAKLAGRLFMILQPKR